MLNRVCIALMSGAGCRAGPDPIRNNAGRGAKGLKRHKKQGCA
jgi:hypothetical protein